MKQVTKLKECGVLFCLTVDESEWNQRNVDGVWDMSILSVQRTGLPVKGIVGNM